AGPAVVAGGTIFVVFPVPLGVDGAEPGVMGGGCVGAVGVCSGVPLSSISIRGGWVCLTAVCMALQERDALAKRCEGSLDRARMITSSNAGGKLGFSKVGFLCSRNKEGASPVQS